MKQIFVTRKGLRVLEIRRLELLKKLKAVQKQKGPAVEDGTWHDNFSFEQLICEENAVSKQLLDIREILDVVIIVSDVPSDTKTLQIGHVARLYIEHDDVTKMVVVGGFGETDLSTEPPIVEYCTPLLDPFYGYEEGHEAIVQLGGISKKVVLESIKMKGDWNVHRI